MLERVPRSLAALAVIGSLALVGCGGEPGSAPGEDDTGSAEGGPDDGGGPADVGADAPDTPTDAPTDGGGPDGSKAPDALKAIETSDEPYFTDDQREHVTRLTERGDPGGRSVGPGLMSGMEASFLPEQDATGAARSRAVSGSVRPAGCLPAPGRASGAQAPRPASPTSRSWAG